MQLMTLQKNLSKTQNDKLMSLYNSVPFIFLCFHDQHNSQWCEKTLQKY